MYLPLDLSIIAVGHESKNCDWRWSPNLGDEMLG